MKTINLTQGQVALVDDWNYNWLNQWKWYAFKSKENYFARRTIYVNRKGTSVEMHRLIMDVPKNQPIKWIDGNTLNCQRSNMVSYSPEENAINRKLKRETYQCSACDSHIRVCFIESYGGYLCGNHRNHMNRNGHILERTKSTPNPIVIKEGFAEIVIFNLKHQEKGRALIDIEDIDLVKNYKWSIGKKGAVSNGRVGKLHRLVLHAQDKNKEVDHWNRNQLDCRKENLREISHSLNIHNSKKWKSNTSGTIGVNWCEKRKVWLSRIRINYKSINLGDYFNKQDAINARLKAEKELLPIEIYPR